VNLKKRSSVANSGKEKRPENIGRNRRANAKERRVTENCSPELGLEGGGGGEVGAGRTKLTSK